MLVYQVNSKFSSYLSVSVDRMYTFFGEYDVPMIFSYLLRKNCPSSKPSCLPNFEVFGRLIQRKYLFELFTTFGKYLLVSMLHIRQAKKTRFSKDRMGKKKECFYHRVDVSVFKYLINIHIFRTKKSFQVNFQGHIPHLQI